MLETIYNLIVSVGQESGCGLAGSFASGPHGLQSSEGLTGKGPLLAHSCSCW